MPRSRKTARSRCRETSSTSIESGIAVSESFRVIHVDSHLIRATCTHVNACARALILDARAPATRCTWVHRCCLRQGVSKVHAYTVSLEYERARETPRGNHIRVCRRSSSSTRMRSGRYEGVRKRRPKTRGVARTKDRKAPKTRRPRPRIAARGQGSYARRSLAPAAHRVADKKGGGCALEQRAGGRRTIAVLCKCMGENSREEM